MQRIIICILILRGVSCDYVSDMVQDNGYPVEIHSDILTPDGYYLTTHRIPYGKDGPSLKKRRPILLMHGILASSDNFVVLGPEKSLGYLLADKGYDVWMGNVRSVSHSRRHIKYDPDKDMEFWKFSYTELATFDLPSIIDYILNTTSSNDLFYAGHSQGSIMFTIMCSELPEYNRKVRLFVALSPALYINDHSHPWIEYAMRFFKFSWENFGLHEVAPGRYWVRKTAPIMCSLPLIGDICMFLIMSVSGYNSAQFNKEYLPNMVINSPEGASVYQIMHLYQIYNTGNFAKYDYGEEKNFALYGNSTPPLYDLSRVKVPTALYYSKADWFVKPENVEMLSHQLPNIVDLYAVDDEHFSHLDFIIANDIVHLLYDRIISMLDEYDNLDRIRPSCSESCS